MDNDERTQPPAEEQLLQHLVQNSTNWTEPINSVVSEIIGREPEEVKERIHDLLTDLQVDGKSIKDMGEQFDKYMGMVREFSEVISGIVDEDQLKAITEDVTHIVALITIMCSESMQCFAKDDAKKTWKSLLRNAELIHDESAATYKRHEKVYDDIYKILTEHLPTKLQFVINVAAAVASIAWQHRETIAKWIAHNWKTIGYVALAFGALVAVGAAVVVAMQPSKKDEEEED